MNAPETSPPLLRIVRGTATPEEVAALVAVLAARGAPSEGTTPDDGHAPWSVPVLRQSPDDAFPLTGPARPTWRSSLLPR